MKLKVLVEENGYYQQVRRRGETMMNRQRKSQVFPSELNSGHFGEKRVTAGQHANRSCVKVVVGYTGMYLHVEDGSDWRKR